MARLSAVPTIQADVIVLCSTAEIPADRGLRVDIPGARVAVFRVESQYFVIDDKCTHGDGSLSEGEVIGAEVECPFHFGRFCVRTGKATAAPCVRALRTYRCEVRDGWVYADVKGSRSDHPTQAKPQD